MSFTKKTATATWEGDHWPSLQGSFGLNPSPWACEEPLMDCLPETTKVNDNPTNSSALSKICPRHRMTRHQSQQISKRRSNFSPDEGHRCESLRMVPFIGLTRDAPLRSMDPGECCARLSLRTSWQAQTSRHSPTTFGSLSKNSIPS